MAKHSAGLLLFRIRLDALEVFLVHPGGPFWARKDPGAWSLPKGEIAAGEVPLAAARREFEEETGSPVEGEFLPLTDIKQPGGKIIHAWAIAGDLDPERLRSTTFSLEWPPRSGKHQSFPEVDRGGWFTVPAALDKLVAGQRGFVTELATKLGRA